MESENSVLAERIDRLERSNKRVLRTSIAIAATGLFLGLAGMAAPALCDTVFTERLVIRDPSGHQRIVADAYSGAPTFSILSTEGRALARIGVAQDGDAYMTFFDAKGQEKGTWKGAIPASTRPETKAGDPNAQNRTVSMLR